jgi:fumarate reductase flavoprotein subunit
MNAPHMFSKEGSIAVGLDGKRFANAELPEQVVDKGPWHELPGMSYAIICDSVILELPLTKIFMKERMGIEQLIASGNPGVAKADSLKELAEQLGINATNLEETVARWNSNVEAGKDPDFGRENLGPGIRTPPFYGAMAYPQLSMLKGGLKVNTECQVLDNYSSVIPGLYAAGDIASGQIQGSARIHVGGGGCAITLNMGRICGINAAAEQV